MHVYDSYNQCGFRRFADASTRAEESDEGVQPAPAQQPAAAFPFWRYVALSVTAGVLSHFIIRRLHKRGARA